MKVGTLEIELLANMARLQKDMNEAKGAVSSAMGSIEKTVGAAKNALGLLGVGLSVGYFANFIKSSIDATGRMKDLAQEAGVSASAISKFEAPARMAGLGLDSVANAMFKMSKASLAAKDPNSAAAQALNAIGLSTEKLKGLKPDEMFELVARSVSKYSDGLAKNNVMQELFGKSGREMNRVVAEIAEKGQLAATVTDEEAEAADRLGDQLVEMKMNSERAWRSILAEGVPAMNEIIRAFIDAKKEGGLLQGVIAGVSMAMEQAFSKSDVEKLKEVNTQIAELQGNNKDALSFWGLEAGNLKVLNGLLATRAALEKTIFDQELEAQNKRALAGLNAGKPGVNFDPEAAAAAATAARKRKAELDKDEANNLKHLAEWWTKVRQAEVDEINVGLELEEKQGALIESFKKQAEQIEFETTLLGLSNVERQTAIALRAMETSGISKQDTAYEELARRMKLAISTQETAREGMAEMQRQAGMWDSLSSSAGNFFGDLVVHGKSAFDSLKQSLKSFAADIIAFFAKRYILSMVAGASGTFGSTAANAAGSALGGMGNSFMGTAISAGSSALFGSAAAYGMATGTSGVQAAMLAAQTAEFGASGLASTAAAGAAGNGSMIAALASNPATWIALAALAAYAIFSKKGGGPKDSGAGSYSVGANGSLTANALTDANRFYRADSHGMDSMVSPIVEATAKSFAAYAKIFGITDMATFVQSTDTDPRGTAPNRAATQAYLNGGLVFSANNADLGRDAAALTPELQLQASRALLAAFQASNLQADLATLLGSVVAASAPQAAIDALFAQATDLSGVLKALGETKVPDLTLDSLRLLQQAGESLGQTFTRVAQDFLNAQGALNQAISGRNPVFARNLTLTARNDIATQFLAGMGQELSTAWLERMALDPASFTGLNTASMSLLAQFLNLQTQLEQLDAQLAIGGSGVVPTLISGLGAAATAAQAFASAQDGLANYLRGSLLSNLSPLSLTQKYDESQSQLQRLIGLATGGDIGAMGQIGGARDAFLGLSQQRFGFSPTYNSDYFRTFDQTNALTNNAASRPQTAADMQQQTAEIIAALTANNNATSQLAGIQAQLYDLVKNGISVNDPQVTALLQEMKNLRLSGGAVSQPVGAL